MSKSAKDPIWKRLHLLKMRSKNVEFLKSYPIQILTFYQILIWFPWMTGLIICLDQILMPNSFLMYIKRTVVRLFNCSYVLLLHSQKKKIPEYTCTYVVDFCTVKSTVHGPFHGLQSQNPPDWLGCTVWSWKVVQVSCNWAPYLYICGWCLYCK